MAARDSIAPRPEPEPHPSVQQQIAALYTLPIRDLQDRYVEVFGEPTRTHHKLHLIRKIAWRLQANDEGGLSQRALRRAQELARDADVRIRPPKEFEPQQAAEPAPVNVPAVRDPRLPPVGTAITRVFRGNRLRVVVREDGFEYEGQRYRTLSAVATAITGSHLNGFRFFRLKEVP